LETCLRISRVFASLSPRLEDSTPRDVVSGDGRRGQPRRRRAWSSLRSVGSIRRRDLVALRSRSTTRSSGATTSFCSFMIGGAPHRQRPGASRQARRRSTTLLERAERIRICRCATSRSCSKGDIPRSCGSRGK
jgi:hypothetical protein